MSGKVYLIGAGPGPPISLLSELSTLFGKPMLSYTIGWSIRSF